MPTVSIWSIGDSPDKPSKYEVDADQANYCVGRLSDPDAVLEFSTSDREVEYVPVRHITKLRVEV